MGQIRYIEYRIRADIAAAVFAAEHAVVWARESDPENRAFIDRSAHLLREVAVKLNCEPCEECGDLGEYRDSVKQLLCDECWAMLKKKTMSDPEELKSDSDITVLSKQIEEGTYEE